MTTINDHTRYRKEAILASERVPGASPALGAGVVCRRPRACWYGSTSHTSSGRYTVTILNLWFITIPALRGDLPRPLRVLACDHLACDHLLRPRRGACSGRASRGQVSHRDERRVRGWRPLFLRGLATGMVVRGARRPSSPVSSLVARSALRRRMPCLPLLCGAAQSTPSSR